MASNQNILNFINGEYTEGTLGKTWENLCPLDGEVISRVHEAGQPEVDAAVTAARRALHGPWGKMSPQDRADTLYRVADGINARFERIPARPRSRTPASRARWPPTSTSRGVRPTSRSSPT